VSSPELRTVAAARTRLGLVAFLVALAALAWWSTVRAMSGMGSSPGTDLGTLGWFVGVWIVMMAAMMLPAVSPTVALYAQMTARRSPTRPLFFTAGYLVVWGAAGVAAYGLFELGQRALGSQLAWHNGGRWLVGGVLVIAAVYELTPLKDVCLSKCRSPFGFLLGSWRDGTGGAFSMGSRHAAWCLGCCWALMAALFALGVMSIFWMAVVAGLITIEKVVPWRRVAVWSTTALLLALAVGVLVAPGSVPGFVIPGGGMPGMSGM
jgi:predicted metal-binding membrane protein